jgi:hypothetical protein
MSSLFDRLQRQRLHDLGTPALPVVHLVSCVGKKGLERAPAKDLYRSDWFKKARAYVEAQGTPWLILSAEHGALDPDQRIAPYDTTLNRMRAAERNRWGGRVLRELVERFSGPTRFVVLAGARYREPIVPVLRELGHEVVIPMEGLGIGEQLSWLKRKIARAGSRSFDVSTVSPHDQGPRDPMFSIRVARFLPLPSTWHMARPREHRAAKIGVVPDFNEERITLLESGGTHDELMALDVLDLDQREDWFGDGDEPGGLLRETQVGRNTEGDARELLRMEWGLREGQQIPVMLLHFTNLWERTAPFRGVSIAPGRRGYAVPEWDARSWTSRIQYGESGFVVWEDNPDTFGEAFTIVLEPEVRRGLGGRRRVVPWPAWVTELYALLAHRDDLLSGQSITRHPFKAEVQQVSRQIEAIVAAVIGAPVGAVYPAR